MTDPKEMQHPPETRRTALVSRRCDLSDRYCKYSRQERRLLEEGLHPGDGSWFRLITVYADSDWIPSNPYRSTPIKGHSSYGEGETGQYVEWLRDYCQAFFGLMVKLLPPVTTAAMVCAFRVNCSSRNLQIHTGERNHLMAYPGHGPGFPFGDVSSVSKRFITQGFNQSTQCTLVAPAGQNNLE
uniref:Uncharacterized protein n=1 Tax=Oncorhynchus mykiss TaxID=8022 RepID=A0A8C7T3W9_ONCMY